MSDDNQDWQNDWLTTMASLAAIIVVYFDVPTDNGEGGARLALEIGIALCAGLVGVWVIVRSVRARLDGRASGYRIVDLVLVVEFVTVVFAFAYYILATSFDGQMSGIATRVDALYFTATTMTTVGYGDIHAVGQFARALTTAHLVFNVIFIAILARLVGHRLEGVGEAVRSSRRSHD